MRTYAKLTALLAVMTLGAGPARAQDENPTTPGAIPNPGTYQGSLALQQQEQQNVQTLQRMDQSYGQYAPHGGGGAGRAGPPPPNLWDKPPLPPAKNPLLGRWRQGAHRGGATQQFGGEIATFLNGAMAGGCDSIFGKGVVAFEPDSLQWVAPDGHEEILNHVSYRAAGAGDIAVLTRDAGALPAMFVGFSNHDHAVVALLNCQLERVGAQRAALTSAPPGSPQSAAVGPVVSAAAGLLDVSVGVGGAPMTNARVWILRESPASALARGGIPVAGDAALEAMASNCSTPQACQRVLLAIGQAALATIKTDGAGHAQLQPPGAGRYYVVGFSPWRDKAVVWVQPVDFKGGGAVRLDAANGRPVG